MKHLVHVGPSGLTPHWHPSTTWPERKRLAAAFRAFVEGIDPHDHETGFYRFDVDADGNAMIGGRAS